MRGTLGKATRGWWGGSGGYKVYVGKDMEIQLQSTLELIKEEKEYKLIQLKDKELVKDDE